MLAKFEPIIVFSEMYQILSFLTQIEFLKTIFDKSVDAILKDVSAAETNV